MEPIFPLTEEHLDRFRGQLVCVVMQDGTRHVGILSRCRNGRLVLNDDAGGDGPDLHADAGGKRRSRRQSVSRKRSGKPAGAAQPDVAYAAGFGSGGWAGPPYGPYGPYGFFGPRLLLDLALIALVFLIL